MASAWLVFSGEDHERPNLEGMFDSEYKALDAVKEFISLKTIGFRDYEKVEDKVWRARSTTIYYRQQVMNHKWWEDPEAPKNKIK